MPIPVKLPWVSHLFVCLLLFLSVLKLLQIHLRNTAGVGTIVCFVEEILQKEPRNTACPLRHIWGFPYTGRQGILCLHLGLVEIGEVLTRDMQALGLCRGPGLCMFLSPRAKGLLRVP